MRPIFTIKQESSMSDVVTRDALYLYCVCNEEGGVNRLSTQASCGGDADTDSHIPTRS